MLRTYARMLLLSLVALCSASLPQASHGQQQHSLRLIAVALEAVDRQNYLQIACGPKAAKSSTLVKLDLNGTELELHQAAATECHGLYAPEWAGQKVRLLWLMDSEVTFEPGEHRIDIRDSDRLRGPRQRLSSRYLFNDDGRGKVSKLIPEGYVLTLTYEPASVIPGHGGAGGTKDGDDAGCCRGSARHRN